MLRLSSAILIFAAHVAFAATEPALPFGDGTHCVAYKVQKTMFLVSSDAVVGKNCDISAQILPEVGGLYHIEVNVPVRSFKSGNEDRDQDVLRLLKAEQRPEMTFKSKALAGDKWRELFAKKDFPLEGELFIGDKSYPLVLQVHYEDKVDSAEVDGTAHVRFEDFGIKPPKVGAGMVAKAKPDFHLFFHLLSQRILGADSIRLGKKQ